MTAMSAIQQKSALRREAFQWKKAAIGLFALSLTVNAAQTARICSLETSRREEAARYQEQLQNAERVRDLAVQELGELSDRWVKEREARAEQAAAYEALGAYRYVGECTVTYYCPCEECCGRWADGLTATGFPAVPGVAAVDPDVIPLGSAVVIDGVRYLAADTGVTGRHVDICVADNAAAEALGVGNAEVWVAEE